MTEMRGMAPSSRALFAGLDKFGLDEMLRIGHEVSFGPRSHFRSRRSGRWDVRCSGG